ncbi:MAG: gliding motility-associated C-terminal domain-containing protein [Bacteroidia bacterium]
MKNKLISTLFLIGAWFSAGAQVQSFSPVLVGSAGGFVTSPGMSLSFSIGEPVVPTVQTPALILTQGFQQPTKQIASTLQFSISKTDLSCYGSNDGTATATVTLGNPPYTYSWNTNPPATTQTITGLAPGTYRCAMADAVGHLQWDTVTIHIGNIFCNIHVYTGFSPNADNKNDTWIIDNIEPYQPNTVSIYNRWGDRVWYTSNYNNSNNVWKGTDSKGTEVPDGTYFYVLQIGPSVQKGWVEVSR